MKKRTRFTTLILASILACAGFTPAAEPGPLQANDIGLNYTLLEPNSLWCHAYTITSFDSATGQFAGTGHSLSQDGVAEIITGTFKDNHISFHVLYTSFNAGYTVDAVGQLDPNGRLSGTAVSIGQQFTWTTSCPFPLPAKPELPIDDPS